MVLEEESEEEWTWGSPDWSTEPGKEEEREGVGKVAMIPLKPPIEPKTLTRRE